MRKKEDAPFRDTPDRVESFGPLVGWLAQAGFPNAEFESQGDLLIVKLDASGRSRLLADSDLRNRFVAQAKAFGFSRVVTSLSTGSSREG